MKNGKTVWEWKFSAADSIVTGEVVADDPREALSCMLTSAVGLQLASTHSIGPSVLDAAPANDDDAYCVNISGCRIELTCRQAGQHTPEWLWHYTVGHKLHLIQQAGALLPRGVMVAPSELPVLWFSADPMYEPSAIKLVQLPGQNRLHRPSMGELHTMIGLFRFRLPKHDARLIPWSALQQRARISSIGARSMIQSGLEIGAVPANWYGVMEPVALANSALEAWTGQDWVQVALSDAVNSISAKLGQVRSRSAGTFSQDELRRGWAG